MDVKFYYTTAAKLASLPIVNGQIIALQDQVGYYYDMNSKRYRVNSVEQVAARPTEGVEGVIYISASPEGIYTWNATSSTWNSILTVDVHEAANDGRMYGRRGKAWKMMRWIIEADSTMAIATVNNIITSLLSNYVAASLKIIGTVNMSGSNLAVTTSKSGQSFYLDLEDMVPSASTASIALKATNATDAIHVSGRVANPVQVTGAGRVSLVGCHIAANVTQTGPANLKIADCDIGAYVITCTSSSTTKAGFNMTGCHMNGGQIKMGADTYFYNMLGDNVLVGTSVTRGGTAVDALYNNAG